MAATVFGTTMVVAAVVFVLAALAWVWRRGRRERDGVDTFRRQIDALSPEARRSTVDQHKRKNNDENGTADG